MGNKMFVVVDGEEGKQYDSVWAITFSPDSKHLAYGAKMEIGGVRLWMERGSNTMS